MDVPAEVRFLRNVEGYLIELVCGAKSTDDATLLAEVLVSVQDALRDLAQEPRFVA
jgi:hypothetical protein